jgi:uncharacterized protein (TIGR03083 family)
VVATDDGGANEVHSFVRVLAVTFQMNPTGIGMMDFLQQCDALETEIDHFAQTLEAVDSSLVVPTCPEWAVVDLARHLGTIHRWAEYLVRHQSERRVPLSALGLEPAAANGEWIREGGRSLLETLRGADPEAPMWSWGADQHVRFWSRRQLHETLIHRSDLELASGMSPDFEAAIAADAIDEFLENLASAAAFSPEVAELRGRGESLVFVADDVDRAWTATLYPDAFEIHYGTTTARAQVSGPASRLALLLYRRVSLERSEVEISGNESLVDFWLAHSVLG